MMLIEQSQVATELLPVDQFTDHLRVGTGFDDDGIQDGVLATYLRVAMTAVEAKTDKILLQRDYTWTASAWRDLGAQVLPVAPAVQINALTIIDRVGDQTVIDDAKYILEQDAHRPRLVASSFVLPSIPVGGTARIDFTAGYGASWDDVPADIAHAVMLLASYYYEHRFETATREGTMPFGVSTLLERYRNIRLFGGRG